MDERQPSQTRPGAGMLLREARERQGLSLEELARRTRIQKSHLELIEEDALHRLPPGPYAEGFVTSYARALGIDPAELAPLLPRSTGSIPAPPLEPSGRREPVRMIRETPVGLERPASWVRWMAGLLLLVGLGALVGMLFPGSQVLTKLEALVRSRQAPVEHGGAGEPPGLEADETFSGVPESRVEPPPLRADASPGAATPATKQAPEPPTRPSIDASADEAGAALPSRIRRLAPVVSEREGLGYDVFSDPESAPGQLQTVVLVVHLKSHVRVTEQLEALLPEFEAVLNPGERKQLRFTRDLWVTLGNVGGVEIFYNDERLGFLGTDGERRGVGFRSRSP